MSSDFESSSLLKTFELLTTYLREGKPEEIPKILESYKGDDWKEYVHFCPHKYARNLVASNEIVEAIILCWLPHQESPIHNHAVSYILFKTTGLPLLDQSIRGNH